MASSPPGKKAYSPLPQPRTTDSLPSGEGAYSPLPSPRTRDSLPSGEGAYSPLPPPPPHDADSDNELISLNDLPLPWELKPKIPPPGFKIPTVTPPRFVRQFLGFEPSSPQMTVEEAKAARMQRKKEWEERSKLAMQAVQKEITDLNVSEPSSPDQNMLHESPSPSIGRLSTQASAFHRNAKLRLSTSPRTTVASPVFGESSKSRRNQSKSHIDIFDVPDSDPVEAVDNLRMDLGNSTSSGTASNLQFDNLETIIVQPRGSHDESTSENVQPTPSIPQKRKAEDDERGWVDTRFGRKKIVKKAPGKRVERLLERGKYENRVWFACKYENQDEASCDVVQQVDLEKIVYIDVMIKDWERAAKRNW